MKEGAIFTYKRLTTDYTCRIAKTCNIVFSRLRDKSVTKVVIRGTEGFNLQVLTSMFHLLTLDTLHVLLQLENAFELLGITVIQNSGDYVSYK